MCKAEGDAWKIVRSTFNEWKMDFNSSLVCHKNATCRPGDTGGETPENVNCFDFDCYVKMCEEEYDTCEVASHL